MKKVYKIHRGMTFIEQSKRARPFLCDNFTQLYELIKENKRYWTEDSCNSSISDSYISNIESLGPLDF
jgi:hypothetical protein